MAISQDVPMNGVDDLTQQCERLAITAVIDRYRKVMSAFPPVKRARLYGSVAVAPALSHPPGSNDNGRSGRIRKGSPPRITHPAHDVKELPVVNGAVLANLADKRIKEDGSVDFVGEQVGKDAHPAA